VKPTDNSPGYMHSLRRGLAALPPPFFRFNTANLRALPVPPGDSAAFIRSGTELLPEFHYLTASSLPVSSIKWLPWTLRVLESITYRRKLDMGEPTRCLTLTKDQVPLDEILAGPSLAFKIAQIVRSHA
jgi:hypothetical protein